ncbi:MAG: type II toxin-antitoxin system RelE/ParE family toxin [Balneolales bacterium]|nr:type II toxin-antitoxin system RelE/ParE family toxin [Balneolales bacterium]
MKVRLHPEALEELNETVQYYEQKAPSLGLSFIIDFEETIDRLILLPESGNEIGGGVRRFVFDKFEHSIIYFNFAGGLEILAIAHMRRKPNYWLYRV